MNCSSDLKNFANSQSSASNFLNHIFFCFCGGGKRNHCFLTKIGNIGHSTRPVLGRYSSIFKVKPDLMYLNKILAFIKVKRTYYLWTKFGNSDHSTRPVLGRLSSIFKAKPDRSASFAIFTTLAHQA